MTTLVAPKRLQKPVTFQGQEIHGPTNALRFLRESGVDLSNYIFYLSHRDNLEALGWAWEASPRHWIFLAEGLARWASYVSEVRSRQANKRLPRNYSLNAEDCQAYLEEKW